MTRVGQCDQGLERDDWSVWTVARGLVCIEAYQPPGEIRNYGSLDGCYRFRFVQRLPDLQAKSGTMVSGRLLEVWFVQRLPDLQARSGTMGLWTVATGVSCTEVS
jgi:hypothetical protein